jgi:hypothetical protein
LRRVELPVASNEEQPSLPLDETPGPNGAEESAPAEPVAAEEAP